MLRAHLFDPPNASLEVPDRLREGNEGVPGATYLSALQIQSQQTSTNSFSWIRQTKKIWKLEGTDYVPTSTTMPSRKSQYLFLFCSGHCRPVKAFVFAVVQTTSPCCILLFAFSDCTQDVVLLVGLDQDQVTLWHTRLRAKPKVSAHRLPTTSWASQNRHWTAGFFPKEKSKETVI